MKEGLEGVRCPKCNGKGTIYTAIGGMLVVVGCDKCRGTGVVNSPNACTVCQGSGTVIINITTKKGGLESVVRCEHCNGSGLEPLTS